MRAIWPKMIGIGMHYLFRVPVKRQLKELYLFIFFQSLAVSLTAIFEPILLWQLGFGLSGIALYFAIHYTVYSLLMPLGAMFADRFGYERSLAISGPLLAVHFIMLANINSWPVLFWAAPLVLSVHKIFFWPAFHANFAKYANKKNRGTELSWANLVAYSSGVTGPVIGGLIAASYGLSVLFVLAAGALLMAVVPMLRTPERQNQPSLTYGSVWLLLRGTRHRRMIVAMFGWVENLIHLAFWPVFVFIAVGNLSAVGVIASLGSAAAVIGGFFIGGLSDRLSPRRVLHAAAPFASLTYIFRFFMSVNPFTAALADVGARLSQAAVSIPFTARLYKNAQQHNVILYALAFEMALAIGKAVAAWGLFIVLAQISFSAGFLVLMAAGAIASFFYAVL